MAILAIETSMTACSAAILPAGGAEPIQRFEPMARGHAEAIFPMIEAVMAASGCGYEALTKIAVTLGPGSFTGVRAGVAAARGIALAAKVPLVGATSLEVMARGCVRRTEAETRAGGFAVLHDARRGELYVQPFDAGGEAIGEAQLLTLSQTLAALPAEMRLIVGSGAAAVAEAARDRGRRLSPALTDLLPEAADLAILAASRVPADRPPAPLYLRPPDAKPQTDKSVVRAQS